ncbi:MAG: hypothetical protein ACSW8A_09605, partial [Lachnospiraceae bacterium]
YPTMIISKRTKPIQTSLLKKSYPTMIIGKRTKPIQVFFSKTVIVSFSLPFLASIFSLFSACIQKSGEYTIPL